MVAKTFRGLEEVLANELLNLGANDIEIQRRAVSFSGDKRLMYKSNIYLRTALRILLPVSEFRVKNENDIYAGIKRMKWDEYMNENSTFAIDTILHSDNFSNSLFVTYRVKDAIVDWFREKTGQRPSIDTTKPDVSINVHISQNQCTISLDSSGDSLHKRGYRSSQNEAPISEVLAAGMLLLAGWDGQSNFIDPMCGSGTILIEAALIALNIPPGIYRSSFGFERWKDFDKMMFDEIIQDDSEEREFHYKIFGSDISRRAIQISEQNIADSGLTKYIHLQQKSVKDVVISSEPCLMVTNPPYGERIKTEDIEGLYETLGSVMKHQMEGNSCWVISSDMVCLKKIGLKPSKKINLLNGPLECSFNQYQIFPGKRKEFLSDKNLTN